MLDWKWLVIGIGAFWYFFMYKKVQKAQEVSLKNENPQAVGRKPAPPSGRYVSRGDTPSTTLYNPMSASAGRTTFNPASPSDMRTYSKGKNRGVAPNISTVPDSQDPAKASVIAGTVIPLKGE